MAPIQHRRPAPLGWLLRAGVLLLAASLLVPAAASGQSRPASLHVTVADFTGGVLAGATVELRAARDPDQPSAIVITDTAGQAVLDGLEPGPHALRIEFPGFEEYARSGLELAPGTNRLDVVLELAGLAAEVHVGRDPQQSGADPRGDSMTTTLGEDELDVLPDEEEELRALLAELAGPGAEFTIDGFSEGALPPVSQIQQIRISRNMYSADRHGLGRPRVEIVSRPGTAAWRSRVGFDLRDDALDARNAFSPARTPRQRTRASGSVQGPLLRDRTSIAVNFQHLAGYDSEIIRAATAEGPVDGVARQPRETRRISGRVQHALGAAHTLRLEYGRRTGEERNLGVGNYDLPERAYTRSQTSRWLRAGSAGVLADRFYNELNIQVRWSDATNQPFTPAPAVRIMDTITWGGATVQGGRAQRMVELHEKLESAWRSHAFSAGGLFHWSRHDSDQVRNANGTFTFSSLADYEAGRPAAFSRWEGDPAVSFAMFRGAWFLQDDIRVRRNLSLGLGLRHEWQSHVSAGRNLGPRVGVTWSPFESGAVTVRGGYGVFHDWYDASLYEQTLQVDGLRGQEITMLSPGYPDPFTSGTEHVLPRGRIQAAEDLRLPAFRQASLGVERALPGNLRAEATYTRRTGAELFRGRNVNAPDPDGVRPLPEVGNIIEVRSLGRLEEHELQTGLRGRLPWRSTFLSVRYTLARRLDDGDGPLSLPADNVRPDEWGPARNDIRHQLSLLGSTDLLRGLQTSFVLRAESAAPYTITTGRDDNRDSVFNDRPAGIGRHSARGAGQLRLDLRLSWRLGFGDAAQPRDGRGASRRAGRADHRVVTELYGRATNVLNSVNVTRFRGAMTSPFFGQPTSARAARQIEIGTRFMF